MENFKDLTKTGRLQVFEQALDETMPSRVISRVVKNHDWNSNPKMYTKQLTGWAKKNLLLECWNQFLAYNEAIHRGFYPGDKGYEGIAQMTRLEIVEMFHDYLGGWLEGIKLVEGEEEDE